MKAIKMQNSCQKKKNRQEFRNFPEPAAKVNDP